MIVHQHPPLYLWRNAYRHATIDSSEPIVFAPQHVEPDGPNGLSSGRNALVEKGSGQYRLRDFTERSEDETLGIPENGEQAPLVDVPRKLTTNWRSLIEAHRGGLG